MNKRQIAKLVSELGILCANVAGLEKQQREQAQLFDDQQQRVLAGNLQDVHGDLQRIMESLKACAVVVQPAPSEATIHGEDELTMPLVRPGTEAWGFDG